jgi:hypothetical protein
MKTPSIDLSFVEWVRRGRHHTGPAAGASVTDGRLGPAPMAKASICCNSAETRAALLPVTCACDDRRSGTATPPVK